MKKTKIEVEGEELLLQSKEGHYAIIPANDRQKLLKLVESGCDDCVNEYIQSLPMEKDYAEDGTLWPPKAKKIGEGLLNIVTRPIRIIDNLIGPGSKKDSIVDKKTGQRNPGIFYSPKSMREGIYKKVAPSTYPLEQVKDTWRGLKDKKVLPKNRMESLEEMEGVIKNADKVFQSKEYSEYLKASSEWEDRYDKAMIKTDLANFAEVEKQFSKERLALEEKYSPITQAVNEAMSKKAGMTQGYGIEDEDAWRFHLGLPQIDNTIIESKTRPSISRDKKVKYYTLRELEDNGNLSDSRVRYKDRLLEDFLNEEKENTQYPKVTTSDLTSLQNFTVNKGKDNRGEFYSIYDKYDFSVPGESLIGKPYEIYDRIYYKDYEGQKKRMHFTDGELYSLNLDNKKTIDYKDVQRELSNRGKYTGKITGEYDEETKKAYTTWRTEESNRRSQMRPTKIEPSITKKAPVIKDNVSTGKEVQNRERIEMFNKKK